MSPNGGVAHRMHGHRLAVGIEAVDAVRESRIPPPLHVLRDDVPVERPRLRILEASGRQLESILPATDRHRTCRHVIRYTDELFRPGHTSVTVRLVESLGGTAPRRFVPRRLEIPLLDPDVADDRDTALRVHRPRLFPGAAYPADAPTTGLRGRVVRGDETVRWARIEAIRSGGSQVVARAHGDDRGEFTLLLGPGARPPGAPTATLEVDVRVFGPGTAPTPDTELDGRIDPLWDLPVESLSLTPDPDPVALGQALPPGYDRSVTRAVELRLGRVVSEPQSFDIE